MRELIEKLSGVTGELAEAAMVKRGDLEPDDLKKVKIFEKAFGGKAFQFFDGISGVIFSIRLQQEPVRIHAEDLAKLKKNARWIEVGRVKEVAVGI